MYMGMQRAKNTQENLEEDVKSTKGKSKEW